MKISEMNWFQLQDYLTRDDRVILSLGSTEQHAYLSLCTDHLLASRLAEEAGEKQGIPVYPGLPFGMAPYFTEFPGTINLQPQTYNALLDDVLSSLYRSGFRRLFLVNGHGGNSPVQVQIHNWLNRHPDARVQLHNWWASPKVMGLVKHFSANASHASWMENFPWTRLPNVDMPREEKPALNVAKLAQLPAAAVKVYIGDGNYGGDYQRSDEEMAQIWAAGLDETCVLLEQGWMP
ncbi:TPA: creatininase family protein [Serratia marcescens]|uniref:creatininase family protein n=1 Tax=Serratia TaxID=613 RepID=UPI001151F7EF|nr:creatininase family protein [Serratia marcescens]MBN5310007.1 creatininase family protein [Serratia marcescens]NSL13100.1 creatininase family protein [Serratia marcescens]QDI13465.1 creatininase family protein [Serratia marcescens]QDI23207.1 creatininase family protein [Serratia marcescens]HEM7573936.1 creatininase family protein [Serratia marcescens]